MLNKIVIGLGIAAVMGLMVAGVAYAVIGSDAGAQPGGRWREAASEPAGSRRAAEGDDARQPEAAAEDWLSLNGVVESSDGSELVLRTETGDPIDVALGQSSYWEAQGLDLAPGEAVVVEGFYDEAGLFSAARLTVVATGQTVVLRDEGGRPLWAGGRRGAGAGFSVEES